MKTKTTPKPPKKNLYPKTIFIENLGDDTSDDLLTSRDASQSLGDDEDEIVIAVYEFKKMVIVRREEKITVTDA
jgi:hypothetical protein